MPKNKEKIIPVEKPRGAMEKEPTTKEHAEKLVGEIVSSLSQAEEEIFQIVASISAKQKLSSTEIKQLKKTLSRLGQQMKKLGFDAIKRIREISGIESKSEIEVDEATMARYERNVGMAKLIDGLEEKENLTENEIRAISSMLERRSWAKMLNNFSAGDRIVTVMTPTDEFLSIKNLNDNIFGPQITDNIIAERRRATEEIFTKHLKEISKYELSELNLEQNFKFGVFRLPKDIADKIDMRKICREADKRIERYIGSLLIKEVARTTDQAKLKRMIEFKNKLESEGFNLDFGIAMTESSETNDKVLALANSMQTARLNGLESKGQDEYGEDRFRKYINRIEELREDLIAKHGNIISGQDGDYQIFEIDASGRHSLNRDLLRDIRKDKFKPREDQMQVAVKIKEYARSLNILDFVKYFTADELPEFSSRSAKIKNLADGFRKNSRENIKEIQEILMRNEKDERFTSNDLFHANAMAIDNCTYLSMDVLDLGVDQLLEYEQLLQAVHRGEISFDEATIRAGDQQTEKLKKIRTAAFNIIAGYENGILLNKHGLAVGLMGGDEFTFAIDSEKISEPELDRLIFRLKEATNSRVVKTVIAESSRSSESADLSNPDNQRARLAEHLESLSRAEKGTELAKKAEEKIRKIKRSLRYDFPQVSRETIEDKIDLLEDFIRGFIVTQIDGGFMFKIENPPAMLTLDKMMDKIIRSIDMEEKDLKKLKQAIA